MDIMVESPQNSGRSLPEALTRTLRHEVGDLLQTIYAAVAILQKRLPAEATLERRVLGDLRSRAEGCKRLLDNVTDLVSPLTLSLEEVDLAQLAAMLVAAVAPRFPKLELRAAPSPAVRVPADEKRLAQIGQVLLTQACEAARHQVCFRTQRTADGEAEWSVTDDRPGFATQELEELFSPFEMIHHGNSRLGLALAQRLVLLHGGRIAADNMPEGGFCIRVTLPTQSPGRTP
jgi:signal transduction histidine kinase